MQISLSDTGKRFNREWIFRNVSYTFLPDGCYAITGPNGSGKSTLLQTIAGAISPSEGTIDYAVGGKSVDPQTAFRFLAIATPYLELIEEMTLQEFLQFHRQFKPFLKQLSLDDVMEIVGLRQSAAKQIRYFSSGMKQRVKLAQCILSDTSCVLLDEPCTNLDVKGIALYHELITTYCSGRLVIISSNDPQEYGFCRESIDIMAYKGNKRPVSS